ncbi:flagellar basal body rod modification protein [Photobacterium sp. SKA34]|uniref:flagellar hook assembly protein FlgD n=1 Tax=Photobacterium TaxID=657 RepID=UPI00006AEB7E|nr:MULTISPECIES: flagellar hook assembly protein FlgD [Photobacterium]EAR57300.1 flagellar basal body rod modification protein [Photobacterium sp. SKA34]KJG02289.1 flagellar basal body rod modification protein [Photobacterium angustum]PSV66907.1 flagellar basal body rod modification protein [Photobacterium angustum]
MTIAQFNALSTDVPAIESTNMSVAGNPNNANDANSLKNEFINLMVAQIQNQDPLNPLDGTEYVGQLAQFSQVESTENMAKLMQNSMVLLDNMQVLSTAGLVGQTVYVEGSEIELADDKQQKGRIELNHASNTVSIVLTDQLGNQKIMPLGPKNKGDVEFTIDPNALDLAKGKYQISIEVEKDLPQPSVLLAGEVSQVRVPSNGGAALVNVEGIGQVPFYQISQFGE